MKKNLYYSEFFYLNIKKKIIDMIQKVKKKKSENVLILIVIENMKK
jgi:hypothetical protein